MITVEIDGKTFSNATDGLRQLAQQFEKAPQKLASEIAGNLEEYLHLIGEKLAERHSGAYPGGGDRLARRTGELVESLTNGIRVAHGSTIDSISAKWEMPDYAPIQETGGVIVGRAGRYLAIPLPAALNGDGTPIKQSPRDWDNTFVATSRQGNLILFRRTGRGHVVPLYVLKRQVSIRARLGLADAIESDMGYFVDKAMTSVLNVILGLT